MSEDYDSEDSARLQNLKDLHENHEKWIADRDDRRRRGLNDLNIFTMLRNQHEEVGLHSRFIGYLLDPDADHGQGDLFLERFMKECGYPNFLLTEDARVTSERDRIDIHITDGRKHVIIENKIYAGDQPTQVERYIDTVMRKIPNDEDTIGEEENDVGESSDIDEGNDTDKSEDNVLVVYLSLRGRDPSEGSLGGDGGWKITGTGSQKQLERDGQYCKYKALRYDKVDNSGGDSEGIWNWLSICHEQVCNITNLSVAIMQYRDVVDKLCGHYEGKTMSFVDWLDEDHERFEILCNIDRDINWSNIKRGLAKKFWDKVLERLNNLLELDGENWKVDTGRWLYRKRGSYGVDRLVSGERHDIPIRVIPKNMSLKNCLCFFGIQYESHNYCDILVGIYSNKLYHLGKDDKEKAFEDLSFSNKNSVWIKTINAEERLDGSLIQVIEKLSKSSTSSQEGVIATAAEKFVDDIFNPFFQSNRSDVWKCDVYLKNLN